MFQVLKSFCVETKEQKDVQMVYRFLLLPSSSPSLTFRSLWLVTQPFMVFPEASSLLSQ